MNENKRWLGKIIPALEGLHYCTFCTIVNGECKCRALNTLEFYCEYEKLHTIIFDADCNMGRYEQYYE